jgi:hypothetical protein
VLEQLKNITRSVTGVSPDAIFVFLGLGCFLTTCLIARRPLTWAWALIPGFWLSIIVETLEIWDHYGAKGLFGTEATEISTIFLRHSKDILVMNLGPSLVVLAATFLDGFSEN